MKNFIFIFLLLFSSFSCRNEFDRTHFIPADSVKENSKKLSLYKISFCPHWLPQAQFAGYYAALDKNFYADAGIELNIQTGGPNNPSSQAVINLSADVFSLWLMNALELRQNGYKIINIVQLINRSALMLISKKSSGITQPRDMNGKKIGIWGGDFVIQPSLFFKKLNVLPNLIIQEASVNLFLNNAVDVTTAMWYNEYHTLLNSGLKPDDLNTFFYSDFGLNFPEEGIYCYENDFIDKPELYVNFCKATLKGWIFAFENEDYVVELVIKKMKELNIPANKTHQLWMLRRMKDLIFPDGIRNSFTKLSEENYNFVCSNMKDFKVLKSFTDYNSFYIPLK